MYLPTRLSVFAATLSGAVHGVAGRGGAGGAHAAGFPGAGRGGRSGWIDRLPPGGGLSGAHDGQAAEQDHQGGGLRRRHPPHGDAPPGEIFPFLSPDWSVRWVYALCSNRIGEINERTTKTQTLT
eukprot:281761-Pyramimonas_sp.AAC.1